MADSSFPRTQIIHAASKNGEHMDSYVTEVLFGNLDQSKLSNIVEAVRGVRLMVKNIPPYNVSGGANSNAAVKVLMERLERCRNQYNNPESEAYKRRMRELLEDEDDSRHSKYLKTAANTPPSDPPQPLPTSNT